jgi:hypothetical protein
MAGSGHSPTARLAFSSVSFPKLTRCFCRLAAARIILESITKPLATDDALGYAAAYRRLEQEAPQAAVPEAAMVVLGESGVIRHRAVQVEAAEPAIS